MSSLGLQSHRLAGLVPAYDRAVVLAERWAGPAVDLAARLLLGKIFLDSGLARVGNWSSQGFLFTHIHPVPGVPAGLAAPLVTGAELVLPVLLFIGLAGRFSAAGLFVMTAVIQFVVAQTPAGMENGIGNPAHYLWLVIAAYLMLRGPGRLSADSLLRQRFGA